MSLTPTFQGEVQFRRYSDSSTQGPGVYFGLAEREALEAFIGKEGKRFMAVLVEIGDDEQPVQPQRKDTRGPLCREACDYCASPEFWAFLSEGGAHGITSDKRAKDWLCTSLDISSRKQIDSDPNIGRWFVENYRVPFARWQRERKR